MTHFAAAIFTLASFATEASTSTDECFLIQNALSRGRAGAAAATTTNLSQAAPCSWTPPSECASSFIYEGHIYSGCCTAGSADSKGWCSHTETYSGGWSGCSWTCEKVSGDGTVVIPFADNWLPSSADLEYLKAEADSAQASAAESSQRGEVIRKATADAEVDSQMKSKIAAKLQQQVTIASALVAKEAQREAALPTIARLAQEEAVKEHQLRIDAEKKLVEIRKKREELDESVARSVLPITEAITKQRLINRIRAAEDARIAATAFQVAEQARYEVEQKKQIEATVDLAVKQALAQREDAMLLTGQILANATGELTAKVVAATASATAQDAAVQRATYEIQMLRAKAEKSKTFALAAQAKAYEDRARADAMALTKATLAKVKDCEDANLSSGISATAEAQAEADAANQVAEVAAAEKKVADCIYCDDVDGALAELRSAADEYGKKMADIKVAEEYDKYAINSSQSAPENFHHVFGNPGVEADNKASLMQDVARIPQRAPEYLVVGRSKAVDETSRKSAQSTPKYFIGGQARAVVIPA